VTPEEQAAYDAEQDKQLRDLAAQMAQMSKLGFDPMTMRKAIIGSVSDTTSPPTVSLNISGDTDTLVTQVRTMNNFTPLVGQTVLLAKQGTEIFLLGAIAATNPYSVGGAGTTDNGWQQATITNGSHGGNSNGNIYFRRVLDHGSWKMQWRGGWAPGGSTILIGAANALDTDFRPSSKRSVLAAREVQTGATALQFDFNTDGTVTLVGATTAPAGGSSAPGGTTDTVDPIDNTTVALSGYLSQGGSDLGHSHGVVGGHWHDIFVNSHSHSITVTAPTWVSLNGVEYFL
jgi:hypothetical protein